jgi:diaminopimelate epimerase
MRITLMSGAGNSFAMVDGFRDELPRDPARLAARACAEISPKPDGLLLVRRPSRGGDCTMELYNADGSRPETCGNGLRCVAKLVRDRGHVKRDEFVIESDAGLSPTTVTLEGAHVVRARIHMGTPRILARDIELRIDGGRDGGRIDAGSAGGGGVDASGVNASRVAGDPAGPKAARPNHGASASTETSVRATLVDVGNPHCVLFVDDERTAPVTTQGPKLEKHAHFPRGTNVEYLALRAGRIYLRVWERGVGETQACGSGACAAAVAAVERGIARFPVRLELPGGTLEVESDGAGGVFLTGPVEELSTFEWTPKNGA